MESSEDLQGPPGERWLSAEAASVFLGPILLAFQAYENDNDALDKRHLVFALNDLGIVDGALPGQPHPHAICLPAPLGWGNSKPKHSRPPRPHPLPRLIGRPGTRPPQGSSHRASQR